MDKVGVTYSVIIVTYFHEKYIEKAMESVLCQSEIDHAEILVGDDERLWQLHQNALRVLELEVDISISHDSG